MPVRGACPEFVEGYAAQSCSKGNSTNSARNFQNTNQIVLAYFAVDKLFRSRYLIKKNPEYRWDLGGRDNRVRLDRVFHLAESTGKRTDGGAAGAVESPL